VRGDRRPADKLTDPEWAALLTKSDGNTLADRQAGARPCDLRSCHPEQVRPGENGLFAPRPEITEGQLFDDQTRASAMAAAEALAGQERRISALYAEQSKLKTQMLALSPGWSLTFRWRLGPPVR
jgi:V/A-type H+-transporting ATPase subunit I